ncbi:MAG: class I fructose-bisphosphate aldolase [Candidatus Gracilibacteria bacterium]|jgi:fructose-bisphosphate aldolase class I
MNLELLKQTAQAMVAPGKGVLAIDESTGTCKKRFEALGVECSEETRREYRELLVTAPEIEQAISGMILYDETLRQSTKDGRRFVDVLKEKGMIPGIKVDTGAKDLALHSGEQVTEGLDGLRERLAEYHALGAQFAKWRAVINISDSLPSRACIKANAHALARYAALCQEADIVPMVEPEMMMEGSHSIERAYEVTAQVLRVLFEELAEQGVALEGTLLKVSMVLAGKDAAVQSSEQEVAMQTVKCLKENVPANIAGVVFLSGGQSDAKSTVHLNLMHQLGETLPWPLSFSYGRGIQQPALKAWAANRAGTAEAQKLLLHRARMNGLAAQGKYSLELEQTV